MFAWNIEEVEDGSRSSSTSEVGSNTNADPININDEKIIGPSMFSSGTLLTELEKTSPEVRNIFQELIKRIPDQNSGQVRLPIFNPARGKLGPRSWLQTVDSCLAGREMTSSDLILTLGAALEGSAANWFCRIARPGLDWPTFKSRFERSFTRVVTSAATFYDQMQIEPKTSDDYDTLFVEMFGILDSLCEDLTKEQIVTAITLAHFGRFDDRIKYILSSRERKNRETLLQELKYIKPGKRKASDDNLSDILETKRHKYSRYSEKAHYKTDLPYCKSCRARGHHTNDCRRTSTSSGADYNKVYRPKELFRDTRKEQRKRRDGKELVCYNCRNKGHFSTQCPDRKPVTKNVGICRTAQPIGQLSHNGEQFSFLFDSGAECSLVSQNLVYKFKGEKLTCNVDLTGLGNSLLKCTDQIRVPVTIDGINLSILFHVVPKIYLTLPIIVGHDIISKDFKMNVTKDKCMLVEIESSTINYPFDSLSRSDAHATQVNQPGEPSSPLCNNSFHDTINKGQEPDLGEGYPMFLCGEDNELNHLFFEGSKNYSVGMISHGNNYDDIVTGLSDEDKPSLISILKKYEPFLINGIPQSRVNTGELVISLKDPSKIVNRKPYRFSPLQQEAARKIIDELLEAKVIEPSTSEFASPALLVPKKTGGFRMCVDYRALNENTIPIRFPLPLIEDQISRLKGAKFFICLDMASGYNQIPVNSDSVEKTAFVTFHGSWQYLAMPFGLRNSAPVFQRAVMQALGNLAHEYVVVYMDDILIIAETVAQALERLERTLSALTKAGFTMNLSKCSFIVPRVSYLGYEIENGKIRPNEKKIEALSRLPPPKTVQSVQQFLGLASYFRKFVRNFSQLAAPLFRLISGPRPNKGSKSIDWQPEHEVVRQKIISILTSSPVLRIFDPNLPIELHTDASSVGYGGILINIVNKTPRIVAYFSKRTTEAESKYHSYELETLAVVKSIQNFHYYLQGYPFKVVTDCSSLKATQNKKDLIPRVQRWWTFLQSYDFTIEYRKASRMNHVDCLSRNPIDDIEYEQERIITSDIGNNLEPVLNQTPETESLVEKSERRHSRPHGRKGKSQKEKVTGDNRAVQKKINLTQISSDWLLTEQNQDPEIKQIVDKINVSEIDEEVRDTYEIRSGILCRKIQRNGRTRCLPMVPNSLKWAVVNNVHNAVVHLGWEKTVEMLYEHYWFENMSKYTRKFVENCLTCKVNKSDSGARQVQLHPIPKTCVPWHTVHLDISGKLSGKNDAKEYLFVFVDGFTKYTLLFLTKKLDGDSAIKALSNTISLFGSPSLLVVDQGRSFDNKKFKDYCGQHQITLHFIATGSSRANGQVERQMRVLKNMLTVIESEEDRTWQQAIGDVQLAINTTAHRVTKYSPMELMFGRVARPRELVVVGENISDIPSVPLDQIREQARVRLDKSANYSKVNFDKGKAKIVPFHVGDLVLLKNEERHQTKLDAKYRGPFKVQKVLEKDRYEIVSISNNRTYKYAHDRLRRVPNTADLHPSDDRISDGEDEEQPRQE
ncbi:hypothetical protein M8J77_005722 [Diaphorina citri]|nr:hypothetical protein M8J77_005722 [Diaphorina citri]